jgi:hypothetical protein
MEDLKINLNKKQQNFIQEKIYYLNLVELKTICDILKIPIYIFEEQNNEIIETRIKDVKINIIKNILRRLHRKKIKRTIIPQKVINRKPIRNLTQNSKIYYGQFKSTDNNILKLMKKLTNNEYKNGAIAFIILRNLWSNGILIDYKKFANLWLKENEKHKKPNIEWAYLTDLNKGRNLHNWKKYRTKIASRLMKIFDKIGKNENY